MRANNKICCPRFLPSKPHRAVIISAPNAKKISNKPFPVTSNFCNHSASISQLNLNQFALHTSREFTSTTSKTPSQKDLLLNFSVQLKRYVDQRDYARAEQTWQEMCSKKVPVTLLNLGLMIETYGKQGKWDAMFGAFRKLKDHNMFPTIRILNNMISSLGKGGLVTELLQIYDAIKSGQLGPNVKPDVVTLNSMLHYLVKAGNVQKMAQVFKEMYDMNVKPSLPTYALLLEGFRGAKDIDTMIEIWNIMKTENIKPSIVVHNYMIEGFANAHRVDDMMKQYQALKKDGINPDLYTYNALLLGYSLAGRGEAMLEVFKHLKAEGFQPDNNTYAPILRYFAEESNLEKLTFFHQQMEAENISHSAGTLNPLLVFHAKQGNLTLLDQYFEAIRTQVSSLTPVFSLIMHNAARTGQVRVLGTYYNKMMELGVEPDIRIFNCLIHGYGKKGFAETMWFYFQKALQQGVTPTNITYNLLMQGFGLNAKEFSRAWEIYDALVSEEAKDLQPDDYTFQVALSIAFRENRFEKVPKILEDMKRYKIPATQRTESTLVQGYSKGSKFKEAAEALLRMKAQNMPWEPDVLVFLQKLLPDWTEKRQELLDLLGNLNNHQAMTQKESLWFSSFLKDSVISEK